MSKPELFPEIARTLKRRICETDLAPGARFLGREDVMREFGVSSKTAQKAFAVLETEGFTASTRGRGTFVAEGAPHRAVFGIALDGPSIDSAQESLFMQAVERAAREVGDAQGIQFTLYRRLGFDMDWDEYARMESDLREHRLAGLVLAHTLPRLGAHGKCPWRGTSVPCVAIGTAFTEEVVAIYGDMGSFMSRAIDHLEGLGRRQVAFLDINVENHSAFDALEHETVERRHLHSPPHWHQRVHSTGIRACLDLLMRPGNADRPDGLVIMDDHAALAATAALAALGVRVPEDLVVVSLGNLGCLPPVKVPVTWIGFDTGELLGRCLDLLRAEREGKRVPKQSWVHAVELARGRRSEMLRTVL